MQMQRSKRPIRQARRSRGSSSCSVAPSKRRASAREAIPSLGAAAVWPSRPGHDAARALARLQQGSRALLVFLLLLVYAAPAEADLSDELEEAPQQQVAPLHRPRKADDGRDWGEATPHSPLGKSQHDKPSLNPSQESSPAPKPGVAAAASSKSTPASRKGGEAPRLSGGKDNASRQLPVTFEGDGLSGARQEGTLTLHAHVKVAQGDFQMFADHAQVFFDPISDEVQKVVAKGRVRMTKIDPQTGQKVRAKSQVVEFEAASQQVLLTGNAELQRDKDTTIRGEFIKYDMASGLINAGRVKGVVQPGKKHE